MFRLYSDHYTILISDHLPLLDEVYREHATLIEHRETEAPRYQEDFLYMAVSRGDKPWPFLIVTQRYSPGPEAGFSPGVLLLPETSLLFVGAGERLLAYRLDPPAKLWEDEADFGFLGWERYKDTVIMSAELELAVWDIRGEKLWTTFVEPPWDYRLDEDTIHVEVMGAKASFPLHDGPSDAFRWW
jgi:hypothetical protein